MYTLIRKIHLYTGVILLVFVIMYFFTGIVMQHGEWFGKVDQKDRSIKTVEEHTLNYTGDRSPEVMQAYLQEQFNLRGKPNPPKVEADGSTRYAFLRPGFNANALVNAAGDHVTVTRVEHRFHNLMHGLHRTVGYNGGWLYWIWALMMDLTSIAMILFAITGIYMWYKLTRGNWLGWACLIVSFGYALSVILYLGLAK
jgi:uncharacterized protein